MIENSERGVTLNKTLAWSMLTALVAGGVWIGTVVTDAKNGVEVLTSRQSEDRQDISRNANAISTLQSGAARLDQRLISIEQGQNRTEKKIDQLLEIYRTSPRP
jgi:uncharacterized protein YlxW (UPF0749 family)